MSLTTLFACRRTAGLAVSLTLSDSRDDTPLVPAVITPESLVI